MFILGQDRDVVVNANTMDALTVYCFCENEKATSFEGIIKGKTKKYEKFRILAWYGPTEDDCFAIGDYDTNERAKEIILEIWQRCRNYVQAYEMPKE